MDPLGFCWPPFLVNHTWAAEEGADSGLSPLAVPHSVLSPTWQMLVAGDGSPTRLLSLLTGEQTHVAVLDCIPVDMAVLEGAPAEVRRLRGPLVRRRILMRGGKIDPPLMYAISWWNADDYAKHMPDPSQPIGRSLAAGKLELNRILHAIYCGTRCENQLDGLVVGDIPAVLSASTSPSAVASSDLGDTTDSSRLWGRHYTMAHGGRPLSVICEVFSPHLSAFLGPQQLGQPDQSL